MPWGHPDATEALWCIGCGLYGAEWVQRRFVSGAPTARIRVCPSCRDRGWEMCGEGVEQGTFYIRTRLAPKPVEVPA